MTAIQAAQVVNRVPDDKLEPAKPGSFVDTIKKDPQALVYLLLNVGDGDTQLLLLPASGGERRRLMIVDVAGPHKLPNLLETLANAEIIDPPGAAGQVRLLVATHPHHDHIGGMADLLDRYRDPGFIDQFWEPGYFYPSPSFHQLMVQLEERPGIRWLQPSSGTSLYLDGVKVTAVGPGVALKTRFDTYGVNVNDASITLMVEYPATAVRSEQDPIDKRRVNRRLIRRTSRRLLLGADAQFTSWAQATVDFPNLLQEHNHVLRQELRASRGRDYLKADLMKLSHHGSKHGVNIELMERVAASLVLVSSQVGKGSYHFPHLLAMEAVREARQATTRSRAARHPDYRLGLHVTGSRLESGPEMGSIAAVISSGNRTIRLYRFLDPVRDDIDLDKARRCRTR